jgi:hypothetical protein
VHDSLWIKFIKEKDVDAFAAVKMITSAQFVVDKVYQGKRR